MSKAVDEVLAEALRLDPKARAELASELLASLEGPPDPDAEAAWEEEIRRRVAAIEAGWHLYSLKPVAEGPIPTRIWIADGQPFQLAGAVGAAEPVTVQDPALGMEVEMYEGEASFTLPVQAAAGAAHIVTASVAANSRFLIGPDSR